MLLHRLRLSILCIDYLAQKNLIVSVELSQILLRTMVSRYLMALIRKAHVLADGMINFWLLVDYALHSLEISAVTIFLVKSGS